MTTSRIRQHFTQSLFNKECLWDLLALFVLVCFAITQPVLDVLAKHPEFFVAWGAGSADIILFAVYLAVLLTLQFVVPIVLVAGVAGRRVRVSVQLILLALLFGIAVLPLIKTVLTSPGWLVIAAAGVCGIAFASLYACFDRIKKFVRLLIPAVIVFPLIFLLSPSISQLVWPTPAATATQQGNIANPVPIVFILFDEFGLTGLLNEDRAIDSEAFPNFAALAKSAVWYKNATTVSTGTTHSVPAMLTGNTLKHNRVLPLQQNYPDNLFTLLQDTYDMRVEEALTQLCGPQVCPPLKLVSTYELLKDMLGDAGYVLLHRILPEAYTHHLPPIDQGWANFQRTDSQRTQGDGKKKKWNIRQVIDDAQKLNMRETFERFINGIDRADKPTLHFLHFLFPHRAYAYVPSGKQYTVEFLHLVMKELWNSDQRALDLEVQRYMFQLGYADKMIGQLVARLKSNGLYDDTLLIVTSDHGIAFEIGKHNRKLTPSNVEDLLSIPLFIKYPGSAADPESPSWPVETVDILPTILDVLDVDTPLTFDGVSLRTQAYPKKEIRHVHDHAKSYKKYANKHRPFLTLPVDVAGGSGVLAAKKRLFTTGPDKFYQVNPTGQWIGKTLSEFALIDKPIGKLSVPDIQILTDFSNDDSRSASPVQGSLLVDSGTLPTDNLLMAINGVVQGATRLMGSDEGEAHFAVFFQESALQPGDNHVEFFLLLQNNATTGSESPTLIKLKY